MLLKIMPRESKAGISKLNSPASLMGMSGRIYLGGAVSLGAALLYFGMRLAFLNLPLFAAQSKTRVRHVLQATVIYLPLLFALMMGNLI